MAKKVEEALACLKRAEAMLHQVDCTFFDCGGPEFQTGDTDTCLKCWVMIDVQEAIKYLEGEDNE